MAEPKPNNNEDEVDPLAEEEETTARIDLLSAYTLHGRLDTNGLIQTSVRARVDEAVPAVEPLVREDEGYYYKEPGENVWTAA